MRLRRRVTAEEAGRRLDDLLGVWLSAELGQAMAKSAVRRLVMAGVVRVAGRPLRRPGLLLDAGQRVEADVDITRLQPARDASFRLTRERVLYEDAWLIAVDKPPGLPTVATADPSRPHLVGAVQAYLKSTASADGPASAPAASTSASPPYLGVHQRLDRDTSGVVLFSKDPAVNPALARAFEGRDVAKTYHALTARPRVLPASSWHCHDSIGGATAHTDFRRLQTFPRAVLVEARPRTGRKHQIRLHLAAAGMPILGDDRYGPRSAASGVPRVARLMLHAAALRLPHPKDGRDLVVESPHPPDLADALAALRGRP